MKKGSLRQEVETLAAAVRRGSRSWHDRMPAEFMDELNAVREAWRAGKLIASKRALAKSIVMACKQRNLPVSGVQGVEDWLDNRRTS